MTEAELILAIETLDAAARNRVLDWAVAKYRPLAAPQPIQPTFIPYPVPEPAPTVNPWHPFDFPGRTITVWGQPDPACYQPVAGVITTTGAVPVFGPGQWIPNGPPMTWS